MITLCGLVAGSVTFTIPSLLAVLPTVPPAVWALFALALVVDMPFVRVRERVGSPVAVSVAFCYAISYALGQGAGRITQVLAIVVAAVWGRRGLWPAAFDIGRFGMALAASGTVAGLVGRVPLSTPDLVALGNVSLAALAWYITFFVLTAAGTWLREGGSWARAVRRGLVIEAVTTAALLALAVMLLGLVYGNAWLIPLVLGPIVAVSLMSYWFWQLQQWVTGDPLTGLPNRLAFEQFVEELIQRLAEHRDGNGMAAFLHVDVNQLGHVNDALGHRVGDEVLAVVGRRLAGLAGPGAMVARLQGDEFAVVMWPVSDAEEALARAAGVRAMFDEPIQVDEFPLLTSVSIGVSLCPVHATSFDVLSRNADTALEEAKGRTDGVAIFQDHQEVATAEQLALLTDLSRAVEEPGNKELMAWYQPQVDMSSGQVVGAEVLLRWRHPTRGMVSPDRIVRVAENSPIMQKVTKTVIEQMLAQLASWQSTGRTLDASVNVSVRDLQNTEFVQWLDGRLRHYGLDPSRIRLEITETALLYQTPAVLDSLNALGRIGVGASLDDFGTGFSSLQHLQQLPLAEIKIDRSFVQSILRHGKEESIVRAVIDMGNKLGLRVVAEGVEDDETRVGLLQAGCVVAQGWYYAGAMPPDQFDEWCRHREAHG